MLKNYLLTALRNIYRYKGFSFINILGLSISMAVCMVIIVVIQDQYSYDSFHTKKKRIFRIESENHNETFAQIKYASTALPIADELLNKYDLCEETVAFNSRFSGEAVYEETRLAFNGLYTGASFFKVFDFKLKNGDPESALNDPFTIVLTEKTATKFFGEIDPMGKFLSIDSVGEFKVTGIISDTKEKSHIQFEALSSLSTLEAIQTTEKRSLSIEDWQNNYSNWAYVLLKEGVSEEDLEPILEKIHKEHYTEDDERFVTFYTRPLAKITPAPILGNEIGFNMPKIFIIFFGGLALMVIISAAFNYTSLSIARSLSRAREVGVRKTVGAKRSQLILQFLSEAILLSLFSLIVAYILLQFLLPAFSGMKMMSFLEIRPEQNLSMYLWFLIFAVVTGVLSGLLPSLFISGIKPVTVLKGINNIKLFSKITLRKILLVTQFVFSIIFVVSIILISRQMNYMINDSMGFDREVVYNIRLNRHKIEKVKHYFEQIPEVNVFSAASHPPGVGNIWDTKARINPEDEEVAVDYFAVDNKYIEAMGLKLLAGNNFPDNLSTKNEEFVIVNEKTLTQFNLGTPAEAIGKFLIIEDSVTVEIIGVVQDYKYVMLFIKSKSLLLRYKPDEYRLAVLRLHPDNFQSTISKLETAWEEVDDIHEMDGQFLDAEIREYYSFFEDIVYTVGFTTILAILVSCLGLLGMATYSIQSRIKEIAIRKVNGAQQKNVVMLISRSYIILLIIASLIAMPLAYMINNLWLQFSASRVPFGIGNLLIGVIIIFIFGMITISAITYRAAGINPARSLKYE